MCSKRPITRCRVDATQLLDYPPHMTGGYKIYILSQVAGRVAEAVLIVVKTNRVTQPRAH